jgi:hypothetical protein
VTCVTYVVAQTSLAQYAGGYRPDLLGVTGPNDVAWGLYHAFRFNLPAAPVPLGSYDGERVCVNTYDIGLGPNHSLGCFQLVHRPI